MAELLDWKMKCTKREVCAAPCGTCGGAPPARTARVRLGDAQRPTQVECGPGVTFLGVSATGGLMFSAAQQSDHTGKFSHSGGRVTDGASSTPPEQGARDSAEGIEAIARHIIATNDLPEGFADAVALARAYLALARVAPQGETPSELMKELGEALAEVTRLSERLRQVCETLVAEVGASGPCDAEDAAERIVAEIQRLRATPPAAETGEPCEHVWLGLIGGARCVVCGKQVALHESICKAIAMTYAHLAAPAPREVSEAMVTKYTIGDTDNRDTLHSLIHVEYAGHGRWAVRRNGLCLGTDGEWDFEPLPSSRDDEWLARYRYADAQAAIAAARAQQSEVASNG